MGESDGDQSSRRGLDAYEVRARLVPAIASVLPLVPMLLFGFGVDGKWVAAVLSAALPLVIAVLASSLAREAGRRVQSRLWGSERISPVVELLQWRSGTSKVEVEQRHRIVRESTGRELPDAAAEAADPKEADGHYRAAETELRRFAAGGEHAGLTRAVTQYGFVRNLRGLRAICVLTSVVAFGLGIWIAVAGDDATLVGLAIAAIAAAYGGIVLWLITDESVRRNGDTYARTLFDACAADRRPPASG